MWAVDGPSFTKEFSNTLLAGQQPQKGLALHTFGVGYPPKSCQVERMHPSMNGVETRTVQKFGWRPEALPNFTLGSRVHGVCINGEGSYSAKGSCEPLLLGTSVSREGYKPAVLLATGQDRTRLPWYDEAVSDCGYFL